MDRRFQGFMLTAALIGTIIAANAAIKYIGVIPIGFGLFAPSGVLFAGLAFTFRDGIQNILGKYVAIGAILIGGIVSYFIADQFAIASTLAFIISELVDFGIYTVLKRYGFIFAVFLSNIAGLIVDSIIFLFGAFNSLEYLPGQIVGKLYMTLLAVGILSYIRLCGRKRRLQEHVV